MSPVRRESRNLIYQKRWAAKHPVEVRCLRRLSRRGWWWKSLDKVRPWNV